MKFSSLEWAAWVLILLGAGNWGLMGVVNVNALEIIFGTNPTVLRLVYGMVGLAGIVIAVKLRREFLKEQ